MNMNSSPEDVMKLLMGTQRIAELSEVLGHCCATATKHVREGDFDKPNLYSAIANTLASVSDEISKIKAIKAGYPDVGDTNDLLDAWGVSVDETTMNAAKLMYTAVGISTTAIDRSLVAPSIIFALNEIHIVLAEDLPFPDDASPEQLERSKVMKEHAVKTKQELEDLIGGKLPGDMTPAEEPTVH